jgi:hypothetical protein
MSRPIIGNTVEFFADMRLLISIDSITGCKAPIPLLNNSLVAPLTDFSLAPLAWNPFRLGNNAVIIPSRLNNKLLGSILSFSFSPIPPAKDPTTPRPLCLYFLTTDDSVAILI